MKEFLSQNNIEYIYIDITDSMLFLKKFLKLRDNRPEFDEIRKGGYVGIPCIVINDGDKFIFGEPKLEDIIEN